MTIDTLVLLVITLLWLYVTRWVALHLIEKRRKRSDRESW